MPAGNPDGGQWTDEGGGGANTRDRVARNKPPKESNPIASDAPAQPTRATDSSPRMLDEIIDNEPKPFDGAEIIPAAGEGGNYGVNLLEHEGINDGHPVSLHVNKSDEFLVVAVRIKQAIGRQDYVDRRLLSKDGVRHGTFANITAANKLVNATIAANSAAVDQFLQSGKEYGSFSAYFNSATGREAYAPGWWGKVELRETYGVRIVLRRDPTFPQPFRVHTAFPIR